MCLEDKAEGFYCQCAKFLCAVCIKSHQRQKVIYPGHKVSTLEELEEGRTKDTLVQEESSCKLSS